MKAYSPAEWVKRPWAMDDVFVQDRQPIPTLELMCAQEASTYKSPPEGRLHPLCALGTSPASAAGDASRIHEQAQWPRIPDGLGSTGGPAQFDDDGPFQQPADWHPASQGALAPPVVIVSAAMERPASACIACLPAASSFHAASCCIKPRMPPAAAGRASRYVLGSFSGDAQNATAHLPCAHIAAGMCRPTA